MLGIDRLGYWAHQYGFGEPTGIDLPGEASGIVPTNQWKQDALGRADLSAARPTRRASARATTWSRRSSCINAYAALANGGKLYQPQVVREIIGARRQGRPAVQARSCIHKMRCTPERPARRCASAARNVVVVRHTYNLVDMPIMIAGKSGTAEFGAARQAGPPAVPLLVRRASCPRTRDHGDPRFEAPATDSTWSCWPSPTTRARVGNAATEIVKYFFQLHFDIKHDYRNFDLLKRGNF